ncbi:MAG: hypothetical protein ACI4F4_11485 [Lachnospiraceae bacterium]
MKLKNCSFNKALFSSDIHRFLPMALLYGVMLLLVGILPTLSNFYSYSTTLGNSSADEIFADTLEMLNCGGGLPLVASVIFAVFIFGYLNKEKEAYSIHAFPVTRESLFMNHFLAGFTLMMIPVIIMIAILCILGFVFGVSLSLVFIWGFVQFMIEHIFYYCFACFVTMLTGNGVMTLILYGILNILCPGFNGLFTGIRSIYIYGVDSYYNNSLLANISPVFQFAKHFELSQYTDAGDFILSVRTEDVITILLSIIPAVIFVLLALLLYKNRSIESTGDLVVFPWAKVVFRVVFTVCSALLFSFILYEITFFNILGQFTYSEQFPFMFIFVMLSMVLFYWLSNVILYRSIHVRKQTSFIKCGILMIVMAIVLISTNKFTLNFNPKECNHIGADTYIYTTDIKSDITPYDNTCYEYTINIDKISDLEKLIYDLQAQAQNQKVINRNDVIGRVHFYFFEDIKTDDRACYSISFSLTKDNIHEVYSRLDGLGTKQIINEE